MSKAQFKAEVCSKAPSFVDCVGKMRVNVQSFATFAGVTPPQCVDGGGALVTDSGSAYSAGGSGEVVLVQVCYEWDLVKKIPFLEIDNMGSGSRLIQAATAFRTEPYSAN